MRKYVTVTVLGRNHYSVRFGLSEHHSERLPDRRIAPRVLTCSPEEFAKVCETTWSEDGSRLLTPADFPVGVPVRTSEPA